MAALIAALAWMMPAAPGAAAGPPSPAGSAAPPTDSGGEQSVDEVNKQLSNPVSELWSITFQQNNFRLHYETPEHGERWSSNLLFQPVLPVAISPDWNLITRPVIPLFVSQPHPDPALPSRIDRSTAFGDIALLQLFSPSSQLAGHWLLGLGPSWIFPTASSRFTGADKWQVGPGAIVGYLSDKWILGALVQNWWSIAGSDSRADTNAMNLQPIAAYFLPHGWSVGYSGNILANWKARGGSVYTVPIGLSVGKVVKLGPLPVRIALAAQYMPVRPDEFGQKWNIQLLVAPVLPKLIEGNLIDPSHMSFGLDR